MDIDITDVKSRELIKILSMYPQGHIEIKFERVFWASDYSEPDIPRENPYPSAAPVNPGQPRGQPPKSASAPFERMADALGRMVC